MTIKFGDFQKEETRNKEFKSHSKGTNWKIFIGLEQ